MTKDRVILAGGSGFLGGALRTELVRAGYECVILSRSAQHVQRAGVACEAWDGRTLGPWAGVLEGACAIVNFTGASVNCRLTERNRHEIIESRRRSIDVLGEALQRCQHRPESFIQCSAVGVYGDTEALCDEDHAAGTGFLAETARTLEAAFQGCEARGVRKVLLRLGVVLGREGGALPPLVRLTRCFLGGAAGPGTQYLSWIHVDDLNRIFIDAVRNTELSGVYNAVAPAPAPNAEFMRTLRRVLGRPWSPPVPAAALRPMAFVLGINADLVLTGQRSVPARLRQAGFEFRFPDLEPALRSLLAGNA